MMGAITIANADKPKLIQIWAYVPVEDEGDQYKLGNMAMANVVAVDIPAAINKFKETYPGFVVTSATIENTWQIL